MNLYDKSVHFYLAYSRVSGEFRRNFREKIPDAYMRNSQNFQQIRGLKKKIEGTPPKKKIFSPVGYKYTRKLTNSRKWSCDTVLKNTGKWTKSSH